MAEKGFGAKACRKWRNVPLQVMQAEVVVRQAWGQNQGAMVEAWELAPPGRAAQKTAAATAPAPIDVDHYLHNPAFNGLFRSGSDVSGLEESEVGQ